jgi:two-component sensor histidine kinase
MYSHIKDLQTHLHSALMPAIVSGALQLKISAALNNPEFWAIVDVLPVAIMLCTDRSCARIEGNAAARALLRVPAGRNLSASAPLSERPDYELFIDGKRAAEEQLPMQRAAGTGEPIVDSEYELRFRDGSRVVIAGHSIPVLDDRGEVCGALGAYVDITARKRLEEQNQFLADELSHRVKNTVAIIQAISRQTIRPLLPEAEFNAYERRLVAIAKAHDLLLAGMRFNAQVGELVQSALSPIAGKALPRVRLSGPPIYLSPQASLTLMMILHELGTNAAKYGALKTDTGQLEIDWRPLWKDGRELMVLDWSESGGPPVESPIKTGFGTRMLQMAVRGVAGGEIKVDYAPDGLKCQVVLPCAAGEARLDKLAAQGRT